LKKRIKPDSTILQFLEMADIKKAKAYAGILKNYNIKSVEQFISVLSPILPKYDQKDIKRKCLLSNYSQIRLKSSSSEVKLKKIRKLFKTSSREAQIILAHLDRVDLPVRAYNLSSSFLSFGLKQTGRRSYCTFWSNHSRNQKISERHYLIPEYERMGEIFDQGSRGTCVANAATSMIDYLTVSQTSRQFLYHQCKMIDGIPQSEGTFMRMPLEIICNSDLIDYGTIPEAKWGYNPHNNSDVPQGPPPETCFQGIRLFSQEPVQTRQKSVVQDVKLLLSGIDGYSAVPVAMGFSLYESFMSSFSVRTGEVSLPLPDEGLLGRHAMLIVGWDDDDAVFIVRNSWGWGYAAENKYRMPGHALIPYAYFDKYTHGGNALLSVQQQEMNIDENDRLYKREYEFKGKKGKIAAGSHSKIQRKKKTKPIRKPKKVSLLPLFIIVLVIASARFVFPEYYFEYRYYLSELLIRISEYLSKLWSII